MLLRNDMPEIERLAEEVTRFANQHGVHQRLRAI
jgi:hypothetical protein